MLPMPPSKGLAEAIRVKAAHRTEAGEIHRMYETKFDRYLWVNPEW
jgi:hypothetical protein